MYASCDPVHVICDPIHDLQLTFLPGNGCLPCFWCLLCFHRSINLIISENISACAPNGKITVRPRIYLISTLPAPSALAGGLMLVAADLMARMLPTDQELKLGVFTALVGAPLFALIAWRAAREWRL